MSSERTVFVSGAYVPESQAKISVFDRSFLFGDGVYEVSTVLDGKLIDNAAHLARLERSLAALQISVPFPLEQITQIQHTLIERNGLKEGIVYLQISRGAADRDFGFPKAAEPNVVLFTQEKNLLNNPVVQRGITIVSLEDQRWKRRDIKSVNLLAPVLAKQAAKEAGVDDAWMLQDGFITEGTSNNAYIISKDRRLITRHLGHEILHGITRKAVLDVARNARLNVEERPFTLDEAYDAAEAFITSASTFVMPVIEIDGKTVGDGVPGPITKQLRDSYIDFALATAR